ncbi:MAG: RedB protein [Bdellovibrionia bacterium]
MTLNKKAVSLFVVILVWFAAIAGGLKILSDYTNAAGAVGQTLPSWPSQSSLTLAQDSKPTLILFLHPKCPCSEASAGELDSLMSKIEGKAHVYALFVQPQGWDESEIKNGLLWKHASAIPGVMTALDPEGKEAKLFGALTSGHMVGFDKQGRLAFSGGITIARGHMGDNPGLQAVAQFVNSGSAPLTRTRVFGCSLFKAHEHRKVAVR